MVQQNRKEIEEAIEYQFSKHLEVEKAEIKDSVLNEDGDLYLDMDITLKGSIKEITITGTITND